MCRSNPKLIIQAYLEVSLAVAVQSVKVWRWSRYEGSFSPPVSVRNHRQAIDSHWWVKRCRSVIGSGFFFFSLHFKVNRTQEHKWCQDTNRNKHLGQSVQGQTWSGGSVWEVKTVQKLVELLVECHRDERTHPHLSSNEPQRTRHSTLHDNRPDQDWSAPWLRTWCLEQIFGLP